jgi:colicin import membrane protein
MSAQLFKKLLDFLDTDFKKALAVSAAAHLVFLVCFAVIPGLSTKKYYFGPVQPVSLTMGAVKGPGKGGPAGQKAAQKKTEKKPAAAKKTNTLKTKKVLPLKTPPKDTYAKNKKQKIEKTKSLKDRISEKLASVEKEPRPEPKPREAEPETDAGTAGASLKLSSGSGKMTAGFGDGMGDVNLPFAWYLDIVQTKISDNWEEPSGLIIADNTLSVVIFFRIERSGNISNLKLKTPSNREDVDSSVLEAVKRSEPLPPLPDEYKGDYLDINIKFDLNR